MIAQSNDVNVQVQRFGYQQRVMVRDNGDPDDPWTGASGTIQGASLGRSRPVYEVWLDTPVRGRHIARFREDELEQIDER